MAPPRVLDWKDINSDTIVYESAKQNKHNGMTVPVKYKDNKDGTLHPIVIQTPVMSLPFGVSDKVLEQYGRKIEASLSFPGYAPTGEGDDVVPNWDSEEMRAFYDWVSMWDELNPAVVAKNSQTFFRKQISDVVVRELYKTNIKPSSQPQKYSPTVRCKVPVASDKPTTDFYNVESKGPVPIDMNRVRTGSRVIALLKTTGLWFAGKSFGMNFHVVQMVQLASDKFEGCAISVPPSLVPVDSTPQTKRPIAFDPGTPPRPDDTASQNPPKRVCVGA